MPVRVWVDGITRVDPSADSLGAPQDDPQRPLLMLGSLDIVGSRWRASDLPPPQIEAGTTLTLNSVNSQDNAEKYTPPFDPGETRSGSQGLTRREQSIAMEFTRLLPGDTLEAFKTFSIDENYSRYGKLSWYATSFGVRDSVGAGGAVGLEYFVRFCVRRARASTTTSIARRCPTEPRPPPSTGNASISSSPSSRASSSTRCTTAVRLSIYRTPCRAPGTRERRSSSRAGRRSRDCDASPSGS